MPKKNKESRKLYVVRKDRDVIPSYYEHDDRGSSRDRQVIFKPSGKYKKWNNSRGASLNSRSRLDDDVEMGGSGFSGRGGGGRRFNPYGNRGGNKKRYGQDGTRSNNSLNANNESDVHRIVIPYGKRYGRDFVLKSLSNAASPSIFIPIGYQVRDKDAVFYVDNKEAADVLRSVDRKVTSKEGYKVMVRVRPCLPPVLDIDTSLKERVKRVMGRRYNSSTRALDLTKLYLDPDLVQDVFFSLARPNAIGGVLDIIGDNIPELVALSLSENSLHTLEHLSSLCKKAPNLNILHLGKNKIRFLDHLDIIRDLPLVELVLDGNPLCDNYREQSTYVSEVRKRFPKVLKLDGVDLPPPIGFDVEDSSKIPQSQRSFFCSEQGAVIARRFLEQYYNFYDSDSRQPLLEAYHENALFSLSCGYLQGYSQSNNTKLSHYMVESRNLIKVTESTRRHKLLRQGKLSIVSFLSELPKSEHDPMSFSVDLTLYTPQLMNLCVSGVFKERSERSAALRAFSRVFVIVPFGSGFCIANEEMFITNATPQQIREAFRVTPPAPAPSPAIAPAPAAPLSVGVDDNTKQQMVVLLSEQSGMNLDWSAKCLNETNWDFQRALHIFTELHKQGKIPAEAFIR